MNKMSLLLICTTAGVLLSGCSTARPVSSHEAPEMSAAQQCSDSVLAASKNKAGKTKFQAMYRDDMTYVRLGDSAMTEHHFRGFPYVESTVTDNGNPGSAWRDCMQQKGFVIGK